MKTEGQKKFEKQIILDIFLLDKRGNINSMKLKRYNKCLNINITPQNIYDSVYSKHYCPECGNTTSFINFTKGYTKCCSYKCSNNSNIVKDKKEKAYMKKYGVKNPNQAATIKEKKKKTCLKKYGKEYSFQAEVVKEKIKETNNVRYGFDNAMQNHTIVEKGKNTMMERYGVERPLQSQVFLDKAKETSQKNFGVEHPAQSEIVKNFTKQTNLKKYGVEYTFQSKELKEKCIKTMIHKYGVENPGQMMSQSTKDKIAITKANFFANNYHRNCELYVIHNKNIKKIKIGVSNNASNRKKSLDKTFGKSKSVFARYFTGALDIEQFLHSKFANKRQPEFEGSGRTEWFDESILVDVIDTINTLANVNLNEKSQVTDTK